MMLGPGKKFSKMRSLWHSYSQKWWSPKCLSSVPGPLGQGEGHGGGSDLQLKLGHFFLFCDLLNGRDSNWFLFGSTLIFAKLSLYWELC